VLVAQRRPQGGQHRRRGEVLAGDELHTAAHPLDLVEQHAGQLRVPLLQQLEIRAVEASSAHASTVRGRFRPLSPRRPDKACDLYGDGLADLAPSQEDIRRRRPNRTGTAPADLATTSGGEEEIGSRSGEGVRTVGERPCRLTPTSGGGGQE